MKITEDKAIQSFKSGLNCAQAVLTAFSDDLHFDYGQALNITCGFGAGMGRLQKTCGAVTGSFMVLGFYNGKKYADNKDKKEFTYSMIQKFSDKFESIHGTTECKSLLKCNLKTEEGQHFARVNNLFEILCEKCIIDSIRIVEELIS